LVLALGLFERVDFEVAFELSVGMMMMTTTTTRLCFCWEKKLGQSGYRTEAGESNMAWQLFLAYSCERI
jgi:hypothetical protein